MYSTEKPKREGKSAEQFCNIINGKYGTSVRKRTVQKHVKIEIVGESPMKKDPYGGLPKDTYRLLAGAFESYVRIQQANGNDATMNKRLRLKKVVKGAVNPILEEGMISQS